MCNSKFYIGCYGNIIVLCMKYLCDIVIQSCTNKAVGYMGPKALRVQNFTRDVLVKHLIIFFKRTSINKGNAKRGVSPRLKIGPGDLDNQ